MIMGDVIRIGSALIPFRITIGLEHRSMITERRWNEESYHCDPSNNDDYRKERKN